MDRGNVSAAGYTLDVCLGDDDFDTSVEFFRRCLKLHPNNFAKTIYYNGLFCPTPFELPYGCVLPRMPHACRYKVCAEYLKG